MHELDADYWENRYQSSSTGWDAGSITDPIKAFMDGYPNRSASILVPGAGNGHEAIYLAEQGFTDITVIDWAPTALNNLRSKDSSQILNLEQADFFDYQGSFDLILEQTFFCALPPEKRKDYAVHMRSLLKPNGRLVGVLFDFPLDESGPPFGGSQAEYKDLFSPLFYIHKLERAYNSIQPRAGKEVWINLEPKAKKTAISRK